MTKVLYGTQRVGPADVFYREAGAPDAPVLLLLHGFPSAGHMFRGFIPLVADDYHVVAPDLPGFGQTNAPPRGTFDYTFDNLAEVISGFTDARGLDRFAMYVFDYGAPVGYRIAAAHPERITAIISQNGNAYEEGFGSTWDTRMRYWRDPSQANRDACRVSLQPEHIRDDQYLRGNDAALVAPDGWELDLAYLRRPGADEIQLDLMLDYRTNVELYPAFQAYFREWQPPLLAAWGRNDRSFIPPGARAFQRDLPDAEVHLLDAGHFALETRADEIAVLTRRFLARRLTAQT
jgi:pimeloyl-ACP methyl ester carboxylesterase